MAFAPVSTWVQSRRTLTHSNLSLCPLPAYINRTPARVQMVMEKPVAPGSDRYVNNSHPESFDAFHSRLGIDKLWDSDQDSEQVHSSENHDRSSSLTTSTNDISVVGDGSTKTVMPWDTTTGAQGISLLGRRMHLIRKRQQLLRRSYEECCRITALFSKTFYVGTTLLSREKRRAVWAIYTWCRRTDDLVDGPRVQQRSDHLRTVLADWENRLYDIFEGRAVDSLDLTMVDTISNYPELTLSPFRDMIRGMLMDVDQSRFETFDDLYLYCYRVAGTVGLMTLPIMGTVKPGLEGLREATEPAVALGIGLQLTNILRDVGEDRLRGRIYLPLEDLRRFNYTEEDLFNCVLDSRYRELMKFEIARARSYFKEAKKGVPLLSEDSRLPVQASLDMYSQILDVLEENGYDNFNRRAYVSKSRKIATLPLSYLRTRISDAWKPLRSLAELLFGAT